MKALRIHLFGHEYHLLGTLETGGAIATVEQYTTGEASFAHYYAPGGLDEEDGGPDGCISRFGAQIGTRADIEVLGEVERERPKPEAFARVIDQLLGPGGALS